MLLRRAFSIYRVTAGGSDGRHRRDRRSPTHGKGTRWLADRRRGDELDVIGPLGRPFTLPKEPVACVLVGGGYGAAPLFALAEQLRARGLPGRLRARRGHRGPALRRAGGQAESASVTVTTDDGSAGLRGPGHRRAARDHGRSGADVVYACGPMAMLAAVAAVAAATGAHSQCAVEEAMACGDRRLHDLRAAGARGRRRDPDGPLLHRRPGVPRRRRALGRRRDRARRRARRAGGGGGH